MPEEALSLVAAFAVVAVMLWGIAIIVGAARPPRFARLLPTLVLGTVSVGVTLLLARMVVNAIASSCPVLGLLLFTLVLVAVLAVRTRSRVARNLTAWIYRSVMFLALIPFKTISRLFK